MWTCEKNAEGLTEVAHVVNDTRRVYCAYLHLHDAMELIHFLNNIIKQEVTEAVNKVKGEK